MIYVGCDDKSNIQVGDLIPLEATPRQSNRVIVQHATEVQACDHDFGVIPKLIPTVVHLMNQSTNPGDLLYSGGKHSTGRTFVSGHDATLDLSSGMKHAARFHRFLQQLARERIDSYEKFTVQGLSYWVLMECYGGPDHNFTFL